MMRVSVLEIRHPVKRRRRITWTSWTGAGGGLLLRVVSVRSRLCTKHGIRTGRLRRCTCAVVAVDCFRRFRLGYVAVDVVGGGRPTA
jgi:hypothetical protein